MKFDCFGYSCLLLPVHFVLLLCFGYSWYLLLPAHLCCYWLWLLWLQLISLVTSTLVLLLTDCFGYSWYLLLPVRLCCYWLWLLWLQLISLVTRTLVLLLTDCFGYSWYLLLPGHLYCYWLWRFCWESTILSFHCDALACGPDMAGYLCSTLFMTFWLAESAQVIGNWLKVLRWLAAGILCCVARWFAGCGWGCGGAVPTGEVCAEGAGRLWGQPAGPVPPVHLWPALLHLPHQATRTPGERLCQMVLV